MSRQWSEEYTRKLMELCWARIDKPAYRVIENELESCALEDVEKVLNGLPEKLRQAADQMEEIIKETQSWPVHEEEIKNAS